MLCRAALVLATGEEGKRRIAFASDFKRKAFQAATSPHPEAINTFGRRKPRRGPALVTNALFKADQALFSEIRHIMESKGASAYAAACEAIRAVNRYVGNLPSIPGVFPDYPAPVIRNTDTEREMALMRWGMPPKGLHGLYDAS